MPELSISSSQLRDAIVGEHYTVVDPSNPNKCTLGDSVFVGPFFEIQTGVSLGALTTVQCQSFICEHQGRLLHRPRGHFIKDTFSDDTSAGVDASKLKYTRIGNFVSIASNATMPSVTVLDDVVIGSRAVATKGIIEPSA